MKREPEPKKEPTTQGMQKEMQKDAPGSRSLHSVPDGQEVAIHRIAGESHSLRQRLMELGLTAKAIVQKRSAAGGVIVTIGRARFAFGRKISRQIEVVPVEEETTTHGTGLDPTPASAPATHIFPAPHIVDGPLPAIPVVAPEVPSPPQPLRYAVIGNPNSGKTTLFNALTGLRQKVANYPGVTVEKKSGWCLSQHGGRIDLIDLPGIYSLAPRSRDEAIARDVLLGLRPEIETPVPERILCVVDACHLDRHLYLVLQVIELGFPVVLALTMADLAEAEGLVIDAPRLEKLLGIPVVVCDGRKGKGILPLKLALSRATLPVPRRTWNFPGEIEPATLDIARAYAAKPGNTLGGARLEGLARIDLAGCDRPVSEGSEVAVLARWQKRFADAGFDWRRAMVEARFAVVSAACREAVTLRSKHEAQEEKLSPSDRADAFLTHPVWGLLALAGTMALVFFALFNFADYPMQWIQNGFAALGTWLKAVLPHGELSDLLTDGVVAGVGGVVVFLPQILTLFFFVSILEESGYLSRTALLLDRFLGRVGLHGKSFLPLLSSYACAIPGIMGTRTIENERSRLATILVAPWMSCSARLPVYSLLIAAMLPSSRFGAWEKSGVMMAMYLLGTSFAFLFAWLFNKTILPGARTELVMELPPYRVPLLRSVATVMWERGVIFLKQAGTVILALSVVLWFLTTHPKKEGLDPAAQLSQSYAGDLGHVLEPAIRPLGFDWKIGIGLVTSFAAREVFSGTMAILHNVGEGEENVVPLRDAIRAETWPDGRPVFTPLVCVGLMVFYVFAMQCLSTVAVVRRETNSWRWPLFLIGYMTAVAYLMALLVHQAGGWLGFA